MDGTPGSPMHLRSTSNDERPKRSVRDLANRSIGRLSRHPLLVVGFLAGVVAVAHALWIWRVRELGGFDPDEASYLSSALSMQRSISLEHPFAFPRTVLSTGHGITVPLLSVPLLILGPRDPRVAMLVQPALLVFIAVATAGITLRTTKRALPAVAAGAWVALLPTVTTAVQSYWYGLGAAAALAGSLWALLASERATNRYIWWYGIGIGLMCTTRTMTLGYLPACLAAGLIVAWPNRHALKRVVGAFALGLAVAAPWYLVNAGAIFGYLFRFGYGDGAPQFGKPGMSDRLNLRYDRMVEGLGISGFLIPTLLILAFVAIQLLRRQRLPRLDQRPFLAIVAVVLLGSAALISTANNGVWFELPLVVVMVAVIVSAAAQLPKAAGGLAGAVVLINAATLMPSSLWLTEWQPTSPTSHYEWGFSEYDERFHPARRDDHERAAADWWALAVDIQQELRRISPDSSRTTFVATGNTHLYNAGVVRMAAELDAWALDLVIPNTMLAREERAKYLGSPGDGTDRVLIAGVHDQVLWPLDQRSGSFVAQAEEAGFIETARFEMPRGGHVAVLRRTAGS